MRRFNDLISVKKFNPYHDSRGRFTSATGAASVTIMTRDATKQGLADAAIERERKRTGAGAAGRQKTKGANGSHYASAAECANLDELREHMRDAYNVNIKDDFKKLEFKVAQESMKGAELVLNDFPKMKDSMVTVHTYRSNSSVFARGGYNVVKYNVTSTKEYDYFDYRMKGAAKSNYHPKNSSVASVGAHEFAHSATFMLYEINKGYATPHEKYQARRSNEISKDIVSKACDNVRAKKGFADKSNYDLVRSISEYARKDSMEAISEAYADIYDNGKNANPVSIEVRKVMKETYEGFMK